MIQNIHYKPMRHQNSDCHKAAIETIVSLPQQVQDVGELLCRSHQEEKAANRRMFLKIVRCIKFLARKGLPLTGVGADSDRCYLYSYTTSQST